MRREPFGRHLLGAAPWLLIFTALTGLLELVGVLSPLSNLGEDTFGIVRGKQLPTDVRIVEIDQHAYDHLFGGKLNPTALDELLDAVEDGGPRLIAVDLFTTSPDFARFRPRPSWKAPIVWAEDVAPDDDRCTIVPDCAYHPLALFGQTTAADRDGCSTRGRCAGVPVYLPESPGAPIRSYQRKVEMRGLEEQVTFAWAILQLCTATSPPQPACRAAVLRSRHEENRQRILYDAPYPWPYTLGAERAVAFAKTAGWRSQSELRHHIVLIGGTYLTLDRHRVPGGVRPGVWLNAQAVENELGRPIVELPFGTGLALDLLVGIALVYLLWRLPELAALGASAGLVLLVMLLSYFVFGRVGVWLNFVPIVVSVALHHLSEHLAEYRHLRREARLSSEA